MDGLRKIDIGTRPKVIGKLLERPELTWVAIASLRLDDRYQRGLGAKNWQAIERIAAGFDWARFTPVLAAPVENGLFAIIDGQHRTHAALMRGHSHVPAMVVAMDTAQQASAFAAVNGDVMAITAFHVYKAALAAREAWALQSRDAVEAAGCRLMTYPLGPAQRKPRQIMTIGLVRGHVAAGRAEVVTRALAALGLSAQAGEVFAWSAAILKPWIDIVATAPETDAELAGFLDAIDLEDLHGRVAALRKRPEFHGLSTFQITRSALKAALNQFRKTGKVELYAA